VLITLAVSVVATAATTAINLLVDTNVGPARFGADLIWSATIASWLVVAMTWCTERVVTSNRNGWKKVSAKVDKVETRLGEVEDAMSDIDKERVQANAVVVQLFRNRQAK
jgi:hypothetical protein